MIKMKFSLELEPAVGSGGKFKRTGLKFKASEDITKNKQRCLKKTIKSITNN